MKKEKSKLYCSPSSWDKLFFPVDLLNEIIERGLLIEFTTDYTEDNHPQKKITKINQPIIFEFLTAEAINLSIAQIELTKNSKNH